MTVKYFYLEGFFKVVNKIQMGLTTQNFLLFLSLLISNTFKKGKKKKKSFQYGRLFLNCFGLNVM